MALKYLSDLIPFKTNSTYSLRYNNKFLLPSLNVKTVPTLDDRAFTASAPKLRKDLHHNIRITTD